LKKADGCILIYDITDQKSFEDIKKLYIPIIKKNCKPNIKTILLGNKIDLDSSRKVTFEMAKSITLANKFIFKETSSKMNDKVDDAFQSLIEIINFEKNNNIGKNNTKKVENEKKNCSIY